LQWNNWVQIIKMIKIQAANRNLPRSQLYPLLFLSPRSLSLTLPVGAWDTRACFGQWKRDMWPAGTYLNLLNGFITSFIHLIFPLIFNMVLQWFNIFNVVFNKSIVVGLRHALIGSIFDKYFGFVSNGLTQIFKSVFLLLFSVNLPLCKRWKIWLRIT